MDIFIHVQVILEHQEITRQSSGRKMPCVCVLRVQVCCGVLQCVAVRCSVLQCVAVCYSVLQRVAACCSVLQCDAVFD